jgi:hypothetical protein
MVESWYQSPIGRSEIMQDARNILIESSFGTVSTLNERINNAVSVWPHVPDAEPISAKPVSTPPATCANAFNPARWFCYHYAGKPVQGKEAVNYRGLCEACEIACPPYEEVPSFMQTNEDDN